MLNQTAIYGLRAVSTLAELAPGESLTATELSARTCVPRQYLSKIMRKLVVAKLVRSRRGRGGGFSLMRPAREIRLGDVLAAVDRSLEDSCVFGDGECDPQNPCSLHPVWSKLKESLASWATESTFGELSPTPQSRQPRRAARP